MPNVYPIHKGKVENGQLELRNRQALLHQIQNMPNMDVEVVIRKWKQKRSIDQNRLYWKYLEIISEETGEDIQWLHEYFKRRFLPKREKEIFGEILVVVESTTALTKQEFTRYMQQIEVETGYPIPTLDYWDID